MVQCPPDVIVSLTHIPVLTTLVVRHCRCTWQCLACACLKAMILLSFCSAPSVHELLLNSCLSHLLTNCNQMVCVGMTGRANMQTYGNRQTGQPFMSQQGSFAPMARPMYPQPNGSFDDFSRATMMTSTPAYGGGFYQDAHGNLQPLTSQAPPLDAMDPQSQQMVQVCTCPHTFTPLPVVCVPADLRHAGSTLLCRQGFGKRLHRPCQALSFLQQQLSVLLWQSFWQILCHSVGSTQNAEMWNSRHKPGCICHGRHCVPKAGALSIQLFVMQSYADALLYQNEGQMGAVKQEAGSSSAEAGQPNQATPSNAPQDASRPAASAAPPTATPPVTAAQQQVEAR